MLKCHFTTILLPYTIMVIKTPFCSWNKSSIFFGITIYGAKKRLRTLFMVSKIFKKNPKWKTIPFMVRVPFCYWTDQKKFFFRIFHIFFEQYYWWALTITTPGKKMEIFYYLTIPYFFQNWTKIGVIFFMVVPIRLEDSLSLFLNDLYFIRKILHFKIR